jgi:hypothetical protein
LEVLSAHLNANTWLIAAIAAAAIAFAQSGKDGQQNRSRQRQDDLLDPL